MKVHFSKFERMAGLFVIIAAAGFCAFTVIVAIKQGWFSARRHIKTTFTHGNGLHPGTLVQISGLRAGTVESVILNDNNEIEVQLKVSSQFDKQLRKDSIARVIRPFIIGDKVVEITVGTKDAPALVDNSIIASEETMDIMDLLGGGKLGPYLATIDNLLKNLKTVAEAFTDPKRSQALIGIFDEALPTMRSLRELTQQATKNKNLQLALSNLNRLTHDVNKMLPALAQFSEHLPSLGKTSEKTMEQLANLTEEINKFLPIIAEIAPLLPDASKKSVEALQEAVVVLRAMQKSFLLKGAVEDVKEEDIARKKNQEIKDKEGERLPANE
ncbi:MAG: MlaD family protein [Oligoflexia bacterium]|nr:MlaD family protein [Oligoflexia bacterium]